MKPGRGPSLRLVYTRAPCVPRSRERENRPAAGREVHGRVKNTCISYLNLVHINGNWW